MTRPVRLPVPDAVPSCWTPIVSLQRPGDLTSSSSPSVSMAGARSNSRLRYDSWNRGARVLACELASSTSTRSPAAGLQDECVTLTKLGAVREALIEFEMVEGREGKPRAARAVEFVWAPTG